MPEPAWAVACAAVAHSCVNESSTVLWITTRCPKHWLEAQAERITDNTGADWLCRQLAAAADGQCLRLQPARMCALSGGGLLLCSGCKLAVNLPRLVFVLATQFWAGNGSWPGRPCGLSLRGRSWGRCYASWCGPDSEQGDAGHRGGASFLGQDLVQTVYKAPASAGLCLGCDWKGESNGAWDHKGKPRARPSSYGLFMLPRP